MPAMLDQTEVDALLNAVTSGTLEGAGMAMPRASERNAARADVSAYDFTRPERVSKDQMRALEALHEGFARNFGASLSGFLRAIVECRVASCEQLTYSEFVRSLPSPTCFNLLRVSPLTGQCCLEISPLIVYPIIDRLLGGNSPEPFIPQRPLTNIEQRLVSRITDRALASLSEAWSNLATLKFELADVESNPHMVQIVAPNEVVVVLGFEIKIGPRSGTMSLCLPFNVIEPVMQKLATQSWLTYSQGGSQRGEPRAIGGNLANARIELTAYLAGTNMTMGELIALAPGDILRLEKPLDGLILVRASGRNKFAGRLGQRRGKRSIQIVRPAAIEEAL